MSSPVRSTPHFASPPRIPPVTPALEHIEAEQKEYIREREEVERRSVMRGLLVLALVALVFSIWRAGASRVFVGRWWWP